MSNMNSIAFRESALTKNPSTIEDVVFSNNTLYIYTKVCTFNNNISDNRVTQTPVPGRMTIALTSVGANSIKVNVINHKSKRNLPVPAIAPKSVIVPQIEEEENEIIFRNNMLEVHIAKTGPWCMRFFYRGIPLTASNGAGGGASYTTVSGVSKAYAVSGNSGCSGDALDIAPDEYFYGLGADGSTVLLNGKSIAIDNKSTKMKSSSHCTNVPFYISSKNYGLFVNTTEKAQFSFGRELTSCVSFNVPEEELEYIFFAGDSMKNVLSVYTQYVGKTSLVPFWSLGTAISLDNDFTLTDTKIIDFLDKMADQGFSVSELYLGCTWLKESDKTGFKWDSARFPDPGAFCRMLHDRNVRLGLGVNPYISEVSAEYQECFDCNYLISYADGNVYMRDCELPGTAILDFTHVAAKSWLQLRLDELLQLGVDFFEGDFRYGLFDFGEANIKFYNGMCAEDVNNMYAKIFNEAIFEATSRSKGYSNAMIIANCASAGSNQFPYLNCDATIPSYSSMSASVRKALSLGMSGFSCCNIDVPTCDVATDDAMFARWFSYAMLSTHFRLHMNIDSNRPVDFKPETFELFKNLYALRQSLAPYLFSCAADATSLGYPVMRPLSLEFQNDPAVYSIDRQYMLGSSIMVVPVLSETGSLVYYMPAGKWTNLLTGEVVTGPCFKDVSVESTQIPVFVRPNSIIASSHADSTVVDTDLNHITFTCFELTDNIVSAAEIYSVDATKSGVINILKQGKKITVRTDGFGSDKKLVLAGIKNVVSVSESVPMACDKGTEISFSGNELVITLG